MLIVYRSKPSNSARELVETLPRCRRAMTFARRPAPGDKVICWGESKDGVPNVEGVELLNGAKIVNKFDAAAILKAAGVKTVEVSRTRPTNVGMIPAVEPEFPLLEQAQTAYNRVITKDQARDLITRLNQFLATPATPARPAQTWLGRRNNHVGGSDLLTPTQNPDYYSKKEDLIEEYRIHCFKGRSIRAGRKVQGVEGRTAPSHEWIRSHDGGWRISYDGFESNKKMRALAAQALKALGLDFGAVDIGKLRDGSLIVLEVNRAPGLEGGTIDAYSSAIEKWSRGEFEGREV